MTHATTATKIRFAALAALGTSLLAAALPAIATSPLLAGWIWVR